jgi:hypothetical protein
MYRRTTQNAEYSFDKMADMYYRMEKEHNSAEAVSLHAEMHLQRRRPKSKKVIPLKHRVRETGCMRPKYDKRW